MSDKNHAGLMTTPCYDRNILNSALCTSYLHVSAADKKDNPINGHTYDKENGWLNFTLPAAV